MTDDIIARVAIHPAIGIARVGNSPDGFFFGPEAIGENRNETAYRDLSGCVKRQAARFRIYAFNAAGQVLKELTAADADISWRVELANRKADWFEFDQALDIPASRGDIPNVRAFASLRRNRSLQGLDRAKLRIEPGSRSLTGADVNRHGADARYSFDTGQFMGKNIYLGELRTDEAGRLLVLGGRGESASYDGSPPSGFANNDTWHDDTSDGPVTAVVKLGNRELVATGAWVVVAPPDFAPGVQALVSGWDLLRDVGCQIDPALRPAQPSFWSDIYPLLRRFADNGWVNAGFAREFGWNAPQNFRDDALLRRLADPSPRQAGLRRSVLDNFRRPASPVIQADAWPPIYGDGVVIDPPVYDPDAWMAITPLQYSLLEQWALGDFEHIAVAPAFKPWNQMTAAEQVAGLDRAVLDETTGGPFHPGAEFTWPMRIASLYDEPFRLKARKGEEPDWGAEITSTTALAPAGPLDGCTPGSITRWMACPWQTDTASCLSAYRPFGGEYLPTFWPARVPNDVLTEADYEVLMDVRRPVEERLQALSVERRQKWLRGIVYQAGVYPPQMIKQPNPRAVFVDAWSHMGIVTPRPGPADQPDWPHTVHVETGRAITPPRHDATLHTESFWKHDPTRNR